jgi:hypothetical protein
VTLSTLPKTLLRRWYLTLGGLLLSCALCFVCLLLIPPIQEVKSSVLLLPPKSAVGLGGNPYLGLGGLKQPVDVLVRALTSQATVEGIKRQWPDTTYTVEPDYLTNGPILVITVDDKNPAASLNVTKQLLTLTPSTLDALQSVLGVRPNAQITSTVIAQDIVPVVVRKQQLRALVLIGALGLGGTALLVGMVDGLLTSRSRRRRATVFQPALEDGLGALDYPPEWTTGDPGELPRRAEAEQEPDKVPSWRGWHVD